MYPQASAAAVDASAAGTWEAPPASPSEQTSPPAERASPGQPRASRPCARLQSPAAKKNQRGNTWDSPSQRQ